MSKKVSPIPRGYRTATPCLTVEGVDEAVSFYQTAFEAELLSRHCGADEVTAVHATIKVGNSIIALHQQAVEKGLFTPAALGASTSQIHLYVEQADLSWSRAIEAGAGVVTPIFDAYWGERTGQLIDANGHIWSIASKVENLSAAELAERTSLAQQVATQPALKAVAPEQTIAA